MSASPLPPAVLARGVSRRQGGRWALRGVDLQVETGEVRMIVGANGAGKTTLVRVLATALAPTSGSLELLGGEPLPARPRVGMLSHADHHYDELSARENMLLAARLCGRSAERVRDVLAQVGLEGREDEPVRGFSAGMRKRLAFARLLLKAPALVLLDEPYAGLDAAGAALVDGLLASWPSSQEGDPVTVIVSTHQLARVAPRCSQATLLAGGRVSWTGPASEAEAQLAAIVDVPAGGAA